MIKKVIFALICMMSFSIVSARNLTVVEQKGKFGYSDESGQIVIKPQFSNAYPFQNGKAKVCKNNKWGYIGEDGKPIIAIEYDNIEPFEKGLARVKKGGKFGFIKEDGTIYIKPEYDFIGSFNEDGWLWVAKGKSLSQSTKGLYRYDKLIIKPSASSFYLGFYVNTDSIDYTNGNPVPTTDGVPDNYEIKENFSRLSESNEPFIWTKALNPIFQILDLDGKLLAKQQNAAVGMPKDGMVMTRTYSKKKNTMYYTYNFITSDGKSKKLLKKDIVQELDPENIYDGCSAFSNGYALCGTGSSSYIINTSGNQVSSTYSRLIPVDDKGFIACQNNNYGIVSFDGKVVVEPKYAMITPSFQGSGVYPAKDNKTNLFGFIDFSGEIVLPFRFDNALAFSEGKGYVKENGLYGIVDQSGQYIVANKWNNLLLPNASDSDFIWVQDKTDNKWKCIQVSKDTLKFSNGFDNVSPFDGKGRALVESNRQFGAVDTDGNMVLPIRFASNAIARKAVAHLDDNNKKAMTEGEAYRFNIYNNETRHKYRLHQTIDSSSWDY